MVLWFFSGSAMQVIAMAAQKGGVGKTTIAGHLAVEAERQGYGKVVLIDTDPQGSLTAWYNVREAERPVTAVVKLDDLKGDLRRLKGRGFDLAIIDTPPALTAQIVKVIEVADLVVIPSRPSPVDLRAIGTTVDLVEALRKPMVFILNGATPRTRIASSAIMLLSQHGTVAPVPLHHRIDFAYSFTHGQTVQELDADGPSAREIAKLWEYLQDRLKKVRKAT
jgi:chromosome partitioning protein